VSLITDARFAARAAALAAYTTGTLYRHHVVARNATPEEDQALIRTTMHRYGRHMTRLYGIDVRKEGVPASGFVGGTDSEGRGRVFVMNHRSGLDILVTLGLLEGKHVSRADLANWPVIGKIARRAGILFVDRENRRSAAAVVSTMIENVENGIGVIIFPEGTTYEGDEVRPFKPGAFAVARRTGCEIVPVGIAYAGNLSFGEESFLEHMRRVSGAAKTSVGFAVGEPFLAGKRDSAQLANAAHAEVQALVHRARALVG
jgi:1-acyl-sn-glycerol-3-phosphate acyltransferase